MNELMTKNAKVFSDDTPKANPWSDDALGFAPFARRLANVAIEMDAPQGYVIGMHGAWGAGKTTALNFVRAYIQKHNQELEPGRDGLRVIEFRPWIFSGQQDLIEAFFKVLSESLDDPIQRRRRLKTRIFKTAKVTVDPLIEAVGTIGAALLPHGAPAIKAGSAIAKKSFGKSIDAWLAEPSLQNAYDQLRQRLAARKQRFLIVIDDIDRLEPAEIRAVMQMVKSIGRLPHVVYLLAYDRRIVWRALSESAPRAEGEPTFAEKIVQHELELPTPGRAALLRLLDASIGFVTGRAGQGGQRWYEIVQSGIYRWIRGPRDVFRFANALHFAWPALEDEIDPLDLVAMEGLRLFEPEVFDWIRQNRDFLMSDGSMRMASEEARAAYGARFREGLPAGQREAIVAVVSALFPTRGNALSDRQRWFGGEAWFEVKKRRGVATPEGYDAYFSLFVSPNAISKVDLDAAVAGAEDPEIQLHLLDKALSRTDERGRSLVGEYISELQFRMMGSDAFKPGAALLDALIARGDAIMSIVRDEAFVLSPEHQMGFLIRDVLKAHGPVVGSELLLQVVGRCGSAAVAADLFTDRAREIGVLPAHGAEQGALISGEAFEALGRRTLELIERAAADGSLDAAPHYWAIATAWAHLAGPEAPKVWLSRGVDADPKFLAKLAFGVLSRSLGETVRRYTFSGLDDRPWYDADALLAACRKHIDAEILDADERSRLKVLGDGLERALMGKPIQDDDQD